MLGGRDAGVALPSYAFQRERYWLMSPAVGAGDIASVGQVSVEHPLLGAALEQADGEGWLFTGRLALDTHPWLADHAMSGVALLAGTAFIELALRAGRELDCQRLRELVLEAPLLLGEGGVQLQVLVGEPDATGERSFSVHSRPLGGAAEAAPADAAESARPANSRAWKRHAQGVLGPGAVQGRAAYERDAAALANEVWPPRDAEVIDVEYLYDRLAEAGYEYGPVFQGLEGLWRRGEEIFAEVVLPEEQREQAGSFGMHPALLDGALHGIALGLFGEAGATRPVRLPFSWRGVELYAGGASRLRARLSPAVGDALSPAAGSGLSSAAGNELSSTVGNGVSLLLSDDTGALLASVDSLVLRALDPRELIGTHEGLPDSLFAVEWVASPLQGAISDAGADTEVHEIQSDVPARIAVHQALELVQSWLAHDERSAESRLVLVTRGAVAVEAEEDVSDLGGAAVWGLIRSAQLEHPGRFVLIDLDDREGSPAALPAALALEESQIAIRAGALFTPRLGRSGFREELTPPAGIAAWRLGSGGGGTFEDLALIDCPEASAQLEPDQVRVAVRAAGMNFRDVLIALNHYPGEAALGTEGAGVVLEVGPGVVDLAPGDHVMGLLPGSFGPIAVGDRRLLAAIPEGWSFAEAASAPAAFITAWYALVDLAGLREGERLLVHAASGGVGMAAVQLARQLGAEVFGTASPGKWDALRALGLDEAHIASSRTHDFKDKFLRETGGQGVDVVLDSLAGDLVDASLQLLPRGGRFMEMGKTDIRDADEVAAAHPRVSYRALDAFEAGPQRIQEILLELLELFARGALEPLPLHTRDLRHAREAFRFMSQARHVGKIVLQPPARIDSEGTVLITGGLGDLGVLVARHLVRAHGVRSLVLASRRGPEAPGAAALEQELKSMGASVSIVACDVSDSAQLRDLIGSIGEGTQAPLRGVVHAAVELDDGVLESLSTERVDRVFAAKADAAWQLHELTQHLDLSMFVLFSSAAATFGSAGQAGYAAANAYLDGLAAHRRARGLPAISLAWGMWTQGSGSTAALDEADLARWARLGIGVLESEEGMELFDAALGSGLTLAVPVHLDMATLRSQAREGSVPSLLRDLVRTPARKPPAAGGFAARLAASPEAERESVVLELVRGEAATVLGHAAPDAVGAMRAFKDLGIDSLTAVELRNRLNLATGLRLSATAVFDYPTPTVLAAQMRRELEGVKAGALQVRASAASEEPIAIVGMSCRLPGGVTSPEQLWDLLRAGGDAISEFPTDRGWPLEKLYHPDPDHSGTSYTRAGGFLYDVAEFDAGFFGISPREALAMDPQQRLLLEASWEALESARIDPHALRGSPTGVYAGIVSQDYPTAAGNVPQRLEGYGLTGGASSVVSGRVAYTFGFEGPAVTVDTACSSSLVALHLAGQALRAGECSLALAGGLTVMATPYVFVEFSRQRGIAADGRCRSFAAAADGTGFSEGVGVVLLERLSDARRRGHEVLAVMQGSAINQDGASNGLSAPNGPSQQRVIVQALANAGVSAAEVDVVEAHGTGTRLGDPIEAQALLATYGSGRGDRVGGGEGDGSRSLWLGSVKSNIGHTQAAAGVAGVIKMVLAMRHGVLPRTLHVDAPSGEVDWSVGGVSLLTEEVPWEANGERLRRAGVSSFGISGTNAHVILEEAPLEEDPPVHEVGVAILGEGAIPWVVSGRGRDGLRGQAGRLREFVVQDPGLEPADVGSSLLGRSAFEHRAVVVGSDRDELLGGLDALAGDRSAAGVVQGATGSVVGEATGAVWSDGGVGEGAGRGGGVAFVFPGQGGQWPGMAVALLDSSPVFAQRLQACAEALEGFVDWSLEDVLRGEAGAPGLERVDVVQPVLFAVMLSLAALWRACGVQPSVVVGHSQGEIAAACEAGGLSLEDAARVVALRSRALGALAGRGEWSRWRPVPPRPKMCLGASVALLSSLPSTARTPWCSPVSARRLPNCSAHARPWVCARERSRSTTRRTLPRSS